MSTSVTLFLSMAILFYCSGVSVHAVDDSEAAALLSIKSSLTDPIGALRDWIPDSPHCNWTGVRCNSLGAVERLVLAHLNLTGNVTEDFRRLPALVHLDLSDNNLYGPFPSGLSSSLVLTAINISGNNFNGPLPEDIGNATQLEILDLRGSFFEGSIPVNYRHLMKLKFLGLSGNNLTGRLPPELGELSSLEKLIISYNEFEGSIPPEFGNLTKLQYLDLALGNLGGFIPPELGKLQQLNTIFLYKNNLEGEIPKELGNISSLVLLDLSDNMLTGTIPPELGQLTNLQLLNLMCNKLEGTVPAGFGELPRLEVLELWNNSLTGKLPANLGRSSSLQWLDVSSNMLSGEIPGGLCDGGNLTKLILFNNRFSGKIPAGLTTCLSLVRVRMQSNRLNGTIPIGLGRLPKLQRLEIANNDLTGEIPDDIALSASLSFIDLSHNRLQLTMPSSILSITTLQTFLASDNQLTGGIPDQFQDCPSLNALDLSNNKLTGRIPASLGSCERLVSLSLRNNGFTGEIPRAIAMMSTLSVLDLSNNQLTGTIPKNFGSSPALETLNLSYNKLSGRVPANGMLRTIKPVDLAGNPGLCGAVLPPCPGDSPSVASGRTRGAHIKHIIAGWMVGIAAVLAIAIALLGGRRLYKYWYVDGGAGCCINRFDEESGTWPWRLTAFQRLKFTSAEILACVKENNVIGMGATGVVYKADMPRHNATVAVKKLWRTSNSTDDAGSVAANIAGEVGLLGRLRHRNIVRLLGYLRNDTDTMILYEYMPNGSLWEALHGPPSGRVLVDWVSRYNVAAGVAQGLAYLHHDCHPVVIHRDVKSNNILLDANLEARIADFGLAKIMLRKNETVSVVAGSYGYIAPEYGYTLKVDQKSDIYSFGVVLMELVTGRRPIDREFGESQDIVGWVREKLRCNRIEEVLDRSIGGQSKHIQEEMLLVLRIAVLCTAKLPKDRPTMRDVLTMLGEAKPRRKSSGASNASAKDKEKPVFTPSPDPEFL